MTNVLSCCQENELTVSDIDNNPVIAGYVSAAQTIHTFDIKYFQPVYNADSAPVVLRFRERLSTPANAFTLTAITASVFIVMTSRERNIGFLFLAVIILLICLYIHTDENTS